MHPFYEKHAELIENARLALRNRAFYSAYPEHPKAYAETAEPAAKDWFARILNTDYTEAGPSATELHGEEVSPYLQTGLGVRYPYYKDTAALIAQAKAGAKSWAKAGVHTRAGVLTEALERLKNHFFEIAYATQHTTGQSFIMSFQASGPHANDRALEAVAMGFELMTMVPASQDWVKPMGKFDLSLKKTWQAMPKGLSLVIGCSTFPTWNTVPGLFASLIAGNPVIVKPHPKAVLPIAIVVKVLRQTFTDAGFDANLVILAADSLSQPITKLLAEHPAVQLIDYTGNSAFGNYIESIPGKTTFTEKAGVNSIIIDSVEDIQKVAGNIAFSLSLYSGQMCTAPQNIFISNKVKTAAGELGFDEVAQAIAANVKGLAENPKAGPGTLGAVQNDATLQRTHNAASMGAKVLLEAGTVTNEEFPSARTVTPVVLETDASQAELFQSECFGPIMFLIKTSGLDESLQLASELAAKHGAITCGAYATDAASQEKIADAMNDVYVPVSFNYTGAAFLNQNAAFSDFHVTGGNAAGNASFTNTDFVSKRFVWVGNRYA